MNLTIEQEVKKRAIKKVYSNSLVGVMGHLSVIFLIAVLLYAAHVQNEILALIIGVHAIVLARRILIAIQFSKVKEELTNYEDVQRWISKYRRVMLYAGISFGLIPFLLQNLSPEYHFLILAIMAGLAAGAMSTIGEIFSIYIIYLLSTIGSMFIFMLLHDGDVYRTAAILLVISIYYFGSTAYRYAKNFEQVVVDEYREKEHFASHRIAQDKIAQQKNSLDYQTYYDMLTSLPNKVLFNEMLENGIQKAQDDNTALFLYFIDLDNFKVVNDSLGHDAGDKLLKAVSSRLKDTISSNDVLSRFGGDEFTVILENQSDTIEASILAKKILKALSEPFFIDTHKFYISSSIGISIYPKDATDCETLIKYADSAMSKAKEEGKNNFQFYSNEITMQAMDRVVLETGIREAIKNEEFVVFYQPQIDATNNRLMGMEALVRWESPKLGLISPIKFIPLAEKSGMIVEIDNLVMNIAMKQFGEWHVNGYNPGVLSLNLAIKHLEQENYINKLHHNMMKYSLDSEHLALELTESDIMKRPEESIKKLKKISALAIRIAIDDFGTGHSSLSYLKKLPVDKLKIDKSFIDDIEDDENGKSIVKAIIALSQSLNLDMIAEGVEDEVQKDFLVENGCNNIQGYYYSKPLSAYDMEIFLKSRMT